mmetsp:Transcript_16/g.67  ORF Transcript_16/g.67 Transcript_16/m.67 type:complete len:237 (-) Transcript_16:553-1263(-)
MGHKVEELERRVHVLEEVNAELEHRLEQMAKERLRGDAKARDVLRAREEAVAAKERERAAWEKRYEVEVKATSYVRDQLRRTEKELHRILRRKYDMQRGSQGGGGADGGANGAARAPPRHASMPPLAPMRAGSLSYAGGAGGAPGEAAGKGKHGGGSAGAAAENGSGFWAGVGKVFGAGSSSPPPLSPTNPDSGPHPNPNPNPNRNRNPNPNPKQTRGRWATRSRSSSDGCTCSRR